MDAAEIVDTDNDGIGNNADTDDDGDGIPDAEDDSPTGGENGGGSFAPGLIFMMLFASLLRRRLK